MTPRRRFGHLRKLPSGRWHASFIGRDGKRITAPQTYVTKTDASRWLSAVELSPDVAVASTKAIRIPLLEYTQTWLEENPRIGPRWRETCQRNLRLHLADLHSTPIGALTPARIREWHAKASQQGGKTSVAQSYRLLRAVLNTAAHDGLIDRNPCTIPGAANPRTGRRPIATPSEITALADAIKPEYRAAVLLGAWAGLRRGEILGLFRNDIDVDNATVTVRRTQTELATSRRPFDSPPKTDAGYRTVALPRHIMPAIEEHLDKHSGRTRVFIDRNGDPMRGDTLYQAFSRARAQVGLSHLRFHDLRHTGQTLAAATGASLPDLMKRLGHASPAAAMRYLHTVDGRDRAIADALTTLAEHGSAATLPDHLRR